MLAYPLFHGRVRLAGWRLARPNQRVGSPWRCARLVPRRARPLRRRRCLEGPVGTLPLALSAKPRVLGHVRLPNTPPHPPPRPRGTFRATGAVRGFKTAPTPLPRQRLPCKGATTACFVKACEGHAAAQQRPGSRGTSIWPHTAGPPLPLSNLRQSYAPSTAGVHATDLTETQPAADQPQRRAWRSAAASTPRAGVVLPASAPGDSGRRPWCSTGVPLTPPPGLPLSIGGSFWLGVLSFVGLGRRTRRPAWPRRRRRWASVGPWRAAGSRVVGHVQRGGMHA
jgi:hypothetical protein